MRHSPERVADVACGIFGLARHQLYAVDPYDGKRRRDPESLRRRAHVVRAIRDISGASFPEIQRALHINSHTSALSAYHGTNVTNDEQLLFEASVRKLLEAFEPKQAPANPTERDTRCDGVWFSPACREEQ